MRDSQSCHIKAAVRPHSSHRVSSDDVHSEFRQILRFARVQRMQRSLFAMLVAVTAGWAPASEIKASLRPTPRPLQRYRSQPVVALAGVAEVWQDYLGLLESAPLVTKSITAGVIIGAGDSAAQLLASRDKIDAEFDVARALRWALFGLVLQGPWNHAFYLLLDGALPPTPDPFTLTTLTKVGIDQGIQAPIFTIIILYFFAVVEGKGFGYATNQVKNDLGGILIKNWSVFLPATVINIGFCPPELRVLFLNVVFFGWVVYLSAFLNAKEGEAA